VNEIFTAPFYIRLSVFSRHAAQSLEFGVCVHNTLTHRYPFASRRKMNVCTACRRVLFTSARTRTVCIIGENVSSQPEFFISVRFQVNQ
jgi:hypothetical protein